MLLGWTTVWYPHVALIAGSLKEPGWPLGWMLVARSLLATWGSMAPPTATVTARLLQLRWAAVMMPCRPQDVER